MPRQQVMDEIMSPEHEAVHKAALEYVEVRDRRMEETRAEGYGPR